MRRARGFTLVELIISMAVIAVLFSGIVFSVGALTGQRAKETSAELAGAIRALYDSASLSGKTCRMVFELPPERAAEDTGITWRAECAKGGVTAAAKRDDELREATKDRDDQDKKKGERRGSSSLASGFRSLNSDQAPTAQELQAREKARVEEAAKYSGFSSDDVQERKLPGNVQIEVWTAKQHDPVKHGLAYLYFFPQGFTERAMIWVRQGSNVWTITVAPLTGRTVIFSEALEVPRS